MSASSNKMIGLKNDIGKLATRLDKHDEEITLLREFKHKANGSLQNHGGKFEAIEGQQKNILDELKLIRADIKEWIEKTNGLLTWQLSIKFMLVGGFGVGTVMVGGVLLVIKMYLTYVH